MTIGLKRKLGKCVPGVSNDDRNGSGDGSVKLGIEVDGSVFGSSRRRYSYCDELVLSTSLILGSAGIPAENGSRCGGARRTW
jgi:hypothetical protein